MHLVLAGSSSIRSRMSCRFRYTQRCLIRSVWKTEYIMLVQPRGRCKGFLVSARRQTFTFDPRHNRAAYVSISTCSMHDCDAPCLNHCTTYSYPPYWVARVANFCLMRCVSLPRGLHWTSYRPCLGAESWLLLTISRLTRAACGSFTIELLTLKATPTLVRIVVSARGPSHHYGTQYPPRFAAQHLFDSYDSTKAQSC